MISRGMIIFMACLVMLSADSASADKGRRGDDSDSIARSHNSFSLSLYHELRNRGGNIFFSPYSIYNVMLMVAEGARNETAVEFGEILQFADSLKRDQNEVPWDLSAFHSWISALNSKYNFSNESELRSEIDELERSYMDSIIAPLDIPDDTDSSKYYSDIISKEERAAEKLDDAREELPAYEIRLANAIWAEKTYHIHDEYRSAMEKYYTDGGIFSADFLNNCSVEKDRINDWVRLRTKGRIERIMDLCDPYIRLVLVNAMYFNGKWQWPFEYKDTKPRDFFLAAGDSVKTPIMTNRHDGRYAAFNADGSFFETPRYIYQGQTEGLYPDADGFAVIEMTYKACDLSMVFIAPNSADGLKEIESQLSVSNLNAWIDDLHARKLTVFIPKFKMEDRHELIPVLEGLGLRRAFDHIKADFSGIGEVSPERNLYISEVIQKTFVKVNEKGTEAAAATVVMINVGSSQRLDNRIPFIPVFRADRPFLFLIRDRTSGMLLFMGRFARP